MSQEKEVWALASPLGGTGFAIAVWTVGLAFSGWVDLSTAIAPAIMSLLFFAGMAQFIVGIIEFRRGSHALGFVHGSYGTFGIMTGIMFIITMGLHWFEFPSGLGAAWYWIAWGIISLILTATSWPVSKLFALDLFILAITFFFFAGGAFSEIALRIGAYLCLFLAIFTWYLVAAFSVNTSFGKKVIPVF